ncbi:hypothetical protein HF888_09670 [Bermanella marisrubri]|uniref:Uncharacterized protein n=1 Tax=Bermanella marisrubri TaxID=207949 RepID=Q1N695_9GAMM|nr:hypothetical protein [Bermanella marisrubri]EAT13697.1 hypothetical protein RED65_09904 [Oceanobacter sp. RED65] [Bermanella marisrubri]QIZ84475.1 hypothetical protein HF888_09670 [Bermanella marisrubri]
MRTVMTYALAAVVLLSSNAMAESDLDLSAKANAHGLELSVLQDFVQSYDFKCPDPISEQELNQQLATLDEESDLAIMIEADRMGWRDLYVESRAQIQCMTAGEVSRGY